MLRVAFGASFLLVSSLACSPKESSQNKSDSVGRHILGQAVSASLPPLTEDPQRVIESLSLTRQRAWEIFGRVIEDAHLEIKGPAGKNFELSIPRFFTWYSFEDVNRLFSLGFEEFSTEERNAGRPFTGPEWMDAERKLAEQLNTQSSPLRRKWEKFFNAQEGVTRESVMGASGLPRTSFNGEMIASLSKGYAKLQECYGKEQKKPAADQPFKPCFEKGLDPKSIMLKANWLNADAGFRKFSTDAESLSNVMGVEDASWENLKTDAPVPDSIVKATMNGKLFVLGGMHIVSREFEDWIWISAWWSDKADKDFGEDRPDFIRKLGAPWNQYKICAVSSFVQDQKELAEIRKKYPSLADAYASVLDGSGASWCSNPYIEHGVNNQKTNCIGCHQFAGTDISESEIISDPKRFPHFGKLKQRSDFPSDYVWGATEGQTSWNSILHTLRPQ